MTPAGPHPFVPRRRTGRVLLRLQDPPFAFLFVMILLGTGGLLQMDAVSTREFEWSGPVGNTIIAVFVISSCWISVRLGGAHAVVERRSKDGLPARRLSAPYMAVCAAVIALLTAFVIDPLVIDFVHGDDTEIGVLTAGFAIVVFTWIAVALVISSSFTVIMQVLIHTPNDLLRVIAERDAGSAALLDAHMETRRTIAEELHGHVQGRLVSMSRRIRNGQLSDTTEIANILDSFAVETVREMSHNMYPSELHISVSASLHRLCGDNAELEVSDSFLDIDQVLDTSLIDVKLRESIYFTVEEALNNAMKHGSRGPISVAVDSDTEHVRVDVSNQCDENHDRWDIRSTHAGSFGIRLINSWVTRCDGTWSLVCEDGTTRLNAEFSRAHS